MFRFTVTLIAALLSFSASAATLEIQNPTIVSINNGATAIQGEWQDAIITDSSYTQTVQSLVSDTPFELSWDLTADVPSILSFDFLGSTIAGGVSLLSNGLSPVLQHNWENYQPITGLTANLEAGVTYQLIVNSYMFDGTDMSRDFTLALSNIELSEVPLPAAVWLFGSVLLGGLALRRKRRLAATA